uniref:Photosystem II assembly protein Ycf48 n=1 Tax=Cyanophora paradoxa TaxID=2762 RepID=A0A097PBJ2_CYAPA|nr:hypothetical protein [Cyanophora paradoxa]
MILNWRKVIVSFLVIILTNFYNISFTQAESFEWKQIPLNTDEILLDIGFVPDQPQRGWLLGTRTTLFETTDKGQTWELRSLNLEDDKYRLNSISFSGKEGWVTGKPAILLHTTDGGSSWSRIPLSNQLPGDPALITALGTGKAELATDIGAIYRTENSGQTWKAQIQEPLGVIRTVARSENGAYVAVSAKGNFYSTWKEGDEKWVSHPRQSSRRIQSMGFTNNNRLWMLTRGGQLWFSPSDSFDEPNWEGPKTPEGKVGFGLGLLNLAFRTPTEIWVSGGSGILLSSQDSGTTWKKETSTENIPSNFYKISFIDKQVGFVLGNQGTLLRYVSL